MGTFLRPRGRAPRRNSDLRRLQLETLEARYALDGATLVNDLFQARQNGPAENLDVLVNDLFDAGYAGARRITSVSYGSEGGVLEIVDQGRFLRYAPPADFAGSETFAYVVDNQFTAQVQVTVAAPLATDDYTILPDGVERPLDVLANDPFWAGYAGPRKITSVSVGSLGGQVTIAAGGGSIRYTPPEDEFGVEEFVYVVDEFYPARVKVTIPQPLKDDRVELVQHTSAVFALLANDPFWAGYDGPRRITEVVRGDSAATIVVSADGRSVNYTPPAVHTGYDSFRYVVDGKYEATVSVAIHRPVADNWFEVDQNSSNFSYNVTANDVYWDLAGFQRDVVNRVTAVTQPSSGGSVTISADGQSVLYTPAAGFVGADEFTYTADGLHQATVRVQVQRPVRDDYLSSVVFQDTPGAVLMVLANDFLGNGYAGPRRITSVSATTQGGVASIGGNGQWIVYTPASGYAGQDTFSYTVDGTLEASVTLQVRSLAQGDYYAFDANPAHGPYLLDVLSNDFFRQGYPGPGTITAVAPSTTGGQIVIVGGQTLRYTPGPTGYDTFAYVVDGKYTATVTFSLHNRLVGDSVVVNQNSDAVAVDVLANDQFAAIPFLYGPYLGPRLVTRVSATQHGGTVTISADGRTVRYQPAADFHGEDSFTYTVDGLMQATVSVHVIRRVRDDQFRVDGDETGVRLPVLVNDLFGADYGGPGRITAVGAASGGGSVTIAADGRSIVYTPRAGFAGADSFVYTVDGKLKAEVRIVVDQPASDLLPTFQTLAQYQQFLIDDALVRYANYFGQAAWAPYLFEGTGGLTAFDAAGPRNHSDTNVQVAGVDEGDIVEFDADYVYALTSEGVTIIDAWPAAEAAVASRVTVEGRPIAQFLHGDRLTVISTIGGEIVPWYGGGVIDFVDGPRVDSIYWPRTMTPATTLVTVIDVSDRTAPTIVQTTSMEGRYVDSRGIGDFVYVLVRNDLAVADEPLIVGRQVDDDGAILTYGRYETREEFLARVTANPGELVDGALPNYSSYGPDGTLVRTGLLNEPEGIFRPLTDDAVNLVSVVSFNVVANEPGWTASAGVYGSGASAVYASLDNFYVFDRDYSSEDGALTQVLKFDWDAATGGVEFAAATSVPGTILNQFSADESGAYLRIATTISHSGAGNWTGRPENTLFVLAEDDGVFEMVGSVKNLALDETMQSIRYMGDRAFVTTFQQVDPLFALDLSDPTNPRALGRLTLPGFATYMQMITGTRLLTVGRNTPGGGSGPTQVALYDVTDLTQPRRIDEYTFERFSTSEAEADHHAFGYFSYHGLLAIPVRRTRVVRTDENGDGHRETRTTVVDDELALLAIDPAASAASGAGVDWVGAISHDAAVRRSGYIDDYLYSLAEDELKVVAVSDPTTVIATVDLLPPDTPLPGAVLPDNAGTLLLNWRDVVLSTAIPSQLPAAIDDVALTAGIEAAQADLARRLQRSAGASVVVTAQSGASTGAYDAIVLRVGDRHYLYQTNGADKVALLDEAFAFGDAADGAWHAVAQHLLADRDDRDADGDVDGGDLAVIREGFASDAAAGDATGDGAIDGADILSWQRRLAGPDSADFNGDAAIDGGDVLAWQRGLGTSVLPITLNRGDADRDGDVDADDLSRWRRAFAGGSATALAAGGSQFAASLTAENEANGPHGQPLSAELADAAVAGWFVAPADSALPGRQFSPARRASLLRGAP